MRIVLVDDHEVVRHGLKALLESQDDFEVVGEAADVENAVRQVGYHSPDVVVMDVRLPDGTGVEACREIKSRWPDTNVLMLTSYADEEALVASLMAGANGYVLKRIASNELVSAVRTAGSGESLISEDVKERLYARMRGEEIDDPLLQRLSPQERRILQRIAQGLTNREIADDMFLAEKTVKNYVSNLLAKLDMSRRSEAAAYAARLQASGDRKYPEEEWSGGVPL